MNREHDTNSQHARELSRRFTQMRQEDAGHLPAFPNEEELAERSPIIASSRLYLAVPVIATAAAVVVTINILMSNPTRQDPGALYTDIMRTNTIATNQLMLVSHGTLPEMISMPDVYEVDIPDGRAQNIN